MLEVKIKLPDPPEGYEYTGEYRPAEKGEYIMDTLSTTPVGKLITHTRSPYPILRKKRWRADKGGGYWYVASFGITSKGVDVRWEEDDLLFNSKNYFQTKEQAEKASVEFKQLFERLQKC